MCVVVPMAAMVALSVASSAAAYAGQQKAANSQREYQNAVYAQQSQQAIDQQEYQNRQVTRNNEYIQANAENTRVALNADQDALVAQERQQGIATGLELTQQRVDRIRASGAIQASERAGLTLESLLADFDRQEASNQQIVNQNFTFASGQRRREGEKLVAVANSRINEARPYEAAPVQTPFAPQPVQGPSLLGTVISTAGQVAGQLNSRSVFDSTRNRYVIGRQTSLPTALPSYSATQRNYGTTQYTTSPRGLTIQKQGLK